MSDDTLSQTLEALVAFLRSESFAVEAYGIALRKIRDPELNEPLARLRNSHQGRVFILRERVSEFGGSATVGDGPWGAFANAHHRLVLAESDQSTIDALAEGETLCVRDYEIDLEEVETHLRREIGRIVLSEQRRTFDAICDLVRTMRGR